MKKPKPDSDPDEMRSEYDFRGGIRGKYVDRSPDETRVVVLDPDVAAEFKDSESVNVALRSLLKNRSDR